jgi:hypothetical protein
MMGYVFSRLTITRLALDASEKPLTLLYSARSLAGLLLGVSIVCGFGAKMAFIPLYLCNAVWFTLLPGAHWHLFGYIKA